LSAAFDIRDYVESNLGRTKDSTGDEITATCPFCDKFGGFYINSVTGKYICFKCDEHGKNIIGIIAQVEGITHEQAVKLVFKRSVKLRRKSTLFTLSERLRALRGLEIEDLEPTQVEYSLPKEFRPCYKDGKWCLPVYLKQRGLRSKTAKRWKLGFCRTGDYAGRLIIPIVCPNGYSFTARDMTGEQEPRYLNPPGADHGRLLIGWDVVKPVGDLCLVEGPVDAIKLHQHGISVLAVGGKVLHADQMSMLFKLSPLAAVTIMLDPEEETAPYKMANQLSVHFNSIYTAHLPLGVDPGGSSKKQAEQAILSAEKFKGGRTKMLRGKINRAKSRMVSMYS
jgi:DNA primase